LDLGTALAVFVAKRHKHAEARFARFGGFLDPQIRIVMENSSARIVFAPPALIQLLRYDLSYLATEAFTPSDDDGWDGWIRLMDATGFMPAGLVPTVRRLLAKYQIPYAFNDARERPDDDLPLHSGFQLRDYQRHLVDRALSMGRGVLDSPPRSGKTLMGAAIIDANPLHTLWIAPTKGIVAQTTRALGKLALGPRGVVGLTGGWPKTATVPGKRRSDELHDTRVVVTTAATAVKAPESFYRSRKILVVDEFHHAAASTYQEINKRASPIYYRYGMTGTHFRSDENSEILMDAVLSDVIGRVEVKQLIDLGFLAPVDFVFVPVEEPKLGPCALDTAYRMGIVNHERRNQWAAWAAQTLMAMGKRVIVLVKHVAHGAKLAGMIPGAQFVQGAGGSGDDTVTDEEVEAKIHDFNAGACPCLVGTSVLGEGIDLPAADALVYAKGGSAAVTVTQDVFRVLTASPGKARAIVVDFADRHHDGLIAQSANRGRIYSREDSFSVDVLGQPMDLVAWLARRQ
jgi:superfamily II DNA or RNA helicase